MTENEEQVWMMENDSYSWRGEAWQGPARLGEARQGKARQGGFPVPLKTGLH